LSRARILVALLLVVPLGFATKLGSGWVQQGLGGTFYVLFFILLVLFIHPSLSPVKAAAGVLAATCALEILQLWHPPFLETVRTSFLGRTLLGTTFGWPDFFFYALGFASSLPLCRLLRSRPTGRPASEGADRSPA
jgi:hypothetical protein